MPRWRKRGNVLRRPELALDVSWTRIVGYGKAEASRQKEELTKIQSQAREEAERRMQADVDEMRQRMAAEKPHGRRRIANSSKRNSCRKSGPCENVANRCVLHLDCNIVVETVASCVLCWVDTLFVTCVCCRAGARIAKLNWRCASWKKKPATESKSAERSAEEKVRRVRDKCERELREMERSETEAREECKAARKKLFELEAELERLHNWTSKKEEEAADIQALYEKLHRDRKNVADVVRQEFADRLVNTDEENKRLKNELAEMRARLHAEQERAQSDLQQARLANEEEMASVHQKVLEAIKKKEEVVLDLRQRYQRKQDECEHLQSLLEQQRKQLASVAGKSKK